MPEADSVYSESDKLTRDGRYPVVDPVPGHYEFAYHAIGMIRKALAAKWTGEKRPPRKGEYFLSGAFIAAYRAPNDLTQSYHIARIVRIEVKRVVHVTEFPLTLTGEPTCKTTC